MNERDLKELYEKQYFHEMEQRSQLLNRMQIPLGVLLALSSVLGFILQSCPPLSAPTDGFLSIFWLILLSTIGAVGFAAYFFIRAWWPGTYQVLPTAVDADQYYKTLQATYAGYSDEEALVEKYFTEFLRNAYRDYSSANALLNDNRARHLSLCVTWLVWAGGMVALTFLLSQLGRVKDYAPITPTVVELKQPTVVDVKGILRVDTLHVAPISVEPLTIKECPIHVKSAQKPKSAAAAPTAPAAIDQRGCAIPTCEASGSGEKVKESLMCPEEKPPPAQPPPPPPSPPPGRSQRSEVPRTPPAKPTGEG